MDSEKLNDILKDENFMKKVLKSDSVEEFKTLFKDRGIELSDKDVEEIASVFSNNINNPMEECELEDISGGKISLNFNSMKMGDISRFVKNISKSVLILSIAGSLVYFAKKGGEVMDSVTIAAYNAGSALGKVGGTVDAVTGAVKEVGGAVGALKNVVNTADSKVQKASTGFLGRLFLNI